MLTETQIEKMVTFWADALFNHSPRAADAALDPSVDVVLAAFGKPKRYTPEQVTAFKTALREELHDPACSWIVSTDYHPNHTLSAALIGAGIDPFSIACPWKWQSEFTVTGGVRVHRGYDSGWEEL